MEYIAKKQSRKLSSSALSYALHYEIFIDILYLHVSL